MKVLSVNNEPVVVDGKMIAVEEVDTDSIAQKVNVKPQVISVLTDGTTPLTETQQRAAREMFGIFTMTQSEYDSIPDPKGIYIIKEA